MDAQCAIHVGQPFTAICSRCGTYMCSACTEDGRFETCAACRARTGMGRLTLRRDAWTFEAALRHAFAAYRQNFVTLTIAFVILCGVVILANSITGGVQTALSDSGLSTVVSAALFLVDSLIQGLLTLGLLSMSLSAARGEGAELKQLFSGIKLWRGWLVQMGLVYLPVVVLIGIAGGIVALFQYQLTNPTLLIILAALGLTSAPALLYLFLGVAFGNTELVAEPALGGVGSLRNAWRIARGQRVMLFGAFALVFVLCTLGLLACLVGVLFAASYSAVFFSTLYLTLRDGAEGLEAG